MHLNRKLSIVRYALADIKSAEMSAIIASLPADGETRQAIEELKEIKNIGDATALEILLSVFALILQNERPNRPKSKTDLH